MEESIIAATRDALYGWTAERLVRKQAALGLPAYLYVFDHGYPAADGAGLHAFHASELPYVFGTLANDAAAVAQGAADRRPRPSSPTPWSTTGPASPRTGRPVAKGEPRLAGRTTRTTAFIAFQDTPRVSANLLPGMYALHEAVVCRRRAQGDTAMELERRARLAATPEARPALRLTVSARRVSPAWPRSASEGCGSRRP